MRIGESLTVMRQAYTLRSIRPCAVEKGKKMAKLNMKGPVQLERLQEGRFDELKLFPDLGLARIRLGEKRIIAFASGEISIRSADSDEDVLRTADMLAALLREP